MTYYRVDVEVVNRTTMYIEANDRREAEDAAEELSFDITDFEFSDVYASGKEIDEVPAQRSVWVGGETGNWVGSEEL